MIKPLYLGCTAREHKRIGIDAVINARGLELWRNNKELEEIELIRDARRIKEKTENRVNFYQICSKFFRRNKYRIAHLLSNYSDI